MILYFVQMSHLNLTIHFQSPLLCPVSSNASLEFNNSVSISLRIPRQAEPENKDMEKKNINKFN